MQFFIASYLISDDYTYTCEESMPFIATSKEEVLEHLSIHCLLEDMSDLKIFTIDEWFEEKGIWLPGALASK